jgi:hypothetical protein
MNTINLENFKQKCQTGDLLLFSSNYWYSNIIKYFSHSNFSHIGIILRDPTYIDIQLKGLYLLESGSENFKDAENNKLKFGVQISDLNKIISQYKNLKIGNLYYKSLKCHRNKLFYNNLSLIHTNIHNKPYDTCILDWLKALYKIDFNQNYNFDNTNKKFWCSALIGYVYTNLHLLDKNFHWTEYSPSYFSYYENKKNIYINCTMEPEQLIIF